MIKDNMRSFILTFFIFVTLSFFGQNNFIFRHIDIIDGLSDSQIRGLSMTADKRICIKTTSSVNLFNGATFEYFYPDKKRGYSWEFYHPKEYYDLQGRIWIKDTKDLILFDINTNSYIYDVEDYLKSLGITKRLKNLFIDDSKNYWFITDDDTLYLYDVSVQQLHVVTEGNSDFTKQYGVPYEMAQYKNSCWIVYTSGLIRCWDYTSHEFVLQDTNFLNKINDKTYKVFLHSTQDGNLWLMYNDAVSYYNRTDKIWKKVAVTNGGTNFFTCMDLDMDDNVWVGTSQSGLRFIDKLTFNVEEISGMQLSTGGILENDIFCVFVDEDNGVWVGTLFQGLFYYHPSMRKFKLMHTTDNNDTHITNETIRCFLENEDGTILIGSGNGLYKFYPKTEKIEKVHNQIKGLCLALYRDSKNRIWVSTFFNGVYCIDRNHIKEYKSTIESKTGRSTVRAVHEDLTGQYWISVHGGVARFEPETGEISMLSDEFPKINKYTVSYDFFPISDNILSVASETGIYFYNSKSDSIWTPETDSPDNPKFQSPNTKYYCVYVDSRSLEWYATEFGIIIWNNANSKKYTLTVEQGLSNNTISGIIEDNDGIMWISTANGISKIELIEKENDYNFSIVNFGTIDGLQSGKFYDRAAFKAKDGTIYFGGIHGFNYFDPRKMLYNKSENKPVFTSFSLFNSLVKEGLEYDGRIILEKPINKTDEIRLNYNENFITLEFSGLNYINPSQTYYRYKLENFDQNWTEVVSNGLGKVVYTGLPPGKYELVIYTANNDKVWGAEPARMNIVIAHPFWATSYAIVFYILLMIIALYYLVYYLNKRSLRKIDEEKERNERKQKEELDQLKFRFFTNISHEFRTPLTLIITPLETLINQQADVSLVKRLKSIYQNANNLLNLVNQLLDFRKLEMKGEKLNLKKGNFIQLIESIYVQFKDTLINKKIDFTLESDIDTVIMYYDQDKIHKIMNNLLSNSLKFTPEGGHVSIHLDFRNKDSRRYIKLSIADNGSGISEKDIEYIFNRFYQTNIKGEYYGSGIGLHIVKEYVDMHEGQISVDSKLGEGTVFTILIPTDLYEDQNEEYAEDKVEVNESLENIPSAHPKKILLVEDNEEFRSFLAEQLSHTFKIIEAPNGRIGEKQAILELPDLIVSDLMMPEMDGIELCKNLKRNIQTSHIPFILLTARSSDEAKMEGYEAGADSYIAKPFNFEILLIRIRKLIEQQEKRKELFHKTIEVTPSSITTSSLDEELVKKALLYVEQNIDNTEYSVDNLSRDVGLSRSQLYRKLQSITGLTPIEFIRSIRLKRAAQLLIKTQYNVSEITDMVGFSTHKYFNKYFKEEFGMTPTQFRNENNNRTQ